MKSPTADFATKKPARRHANPAAEFLRAIGAIVWKDLAAELRSRELLSAMLVFSLTVIMIFNFALELDAKTRYSGDIRSFMGHFCICRDFGSQPIDGDGKRPWLHGWPTAGAC